MPWVSILYGYRVPMEENGEKEVKYYSCCHIDEKDLLKKYCGKCGIRVKIIKNTFQTYKHDSISLPSPLKFFRPRMEQKHVYLTDLVFVNHPIDIYHRPIPVKDNKKILEDAILKYCPDLMHKANYGLWILDETDYGSDDW